MNIIWTLLGVTFCYCTPQNKPMTVLMHSGYLGLAESNIEPEDGRIWQCSNNHYLHWSFLSFLWGLNVTFSGHKRWVCPKVEDFAQDVAMSCNVNNWGTWKETPLDGWIPGVQTKPPYIEQVFPQKRQWNRVEIWQGLYTVSFHKLADLWKHKIVRELEQVRAMPVSNCRHQSDLMPYQINPPMCPSDLMEQRNILDQAAHSSVQSFRVSIHPPLLGSSSHRTYKKCTFSSEAIGSKSCFTCFSNVHWGGSGCGNNGATLEMPFCWSRGVSNDCGVKASIPLVSSWDLFEKMANACKPKWVVKVR